MNYRINYCIHTCKEYEKFTKNLVPCRVGINKSNGEFMSNEYAIVSLLFKIFDVKEPTFISIVKDKNNQFLTVFAMLNEVLKSSSYIYSPVMNVQLCNDNVMCTDDPIHLGYQCLSLTKASMMEPKLKDYIKFDGLDITMIDPTPIPPELYTTTVETEGSTHILKSSDCPTDGKFEGNYVDCLEYLYDNRSDKELCHQYALVRDRSTKSIQILEYSKSVKIDRSKQPIICIGSIDKINEKLKEITYKYSDNRYHVWRKSIAYQICLEPNPEVEFSGNLNECNDFIYRKIKSEPSGWKYAVYRAPKEFPYIGIYNSGDDDFHGSLNECSEYLTNWYKYNFTQNTFAVYIGQNEFPRIGIYYKNVDAEFHGDLQECSEYLTDWYKHNPISRTYAVYRGSNEFPRIGIYDNGDDAEFHGTIQECNQHIANWCKNNVDMIKMLAHG